MTGTEINLRLTDLVNAHAWSRQFDKVNLTDGQRICISQERAALMAVLDGIDTTPRYRIPDHVNQKVEQITTIIKNTNWQLPEHTPEPY